MQMCVCGRLRVNTKNDSNICMSRWNKFLSSFLFRIQYFFPLCLNYFLWLTLYLYFIFSVTDQCAFDDFTKTTSLLFQKNKTLQKYLTQHIFLLFLGKRRSCERNEVKVCSNYTLNRKNTFVRPQKEVELKWLIWLSSGSKTRSDLFSLGAE